jgi:hypothetical protein
MAGTGGTLSQAAEADRTVWLAQGYNPGDTTLHDPTTDGGRLGYADLRAWLGCALIVSSTLSQAVTIHLVGALSRTTSIPQAVVDIESALSLVAYSSGAPVQGTWWLHPAAGLWFPWIYAQVQAAGVPTGTLEISVFKGEYQCADPAILGISQ